MGRASSATRSLTHQVLVAAFVGLTMLVLAGCGAGPGGPVPGPAASMAASPGAGTPSASPLSGVPVAAAGGPSAAALMVCGEETRANIVRILALPSPPGTSASWADKLYTCTYALPGGALVLSVKEVPDPDTAHTYFQDLQRTTAGAAPIEGLANLGFPAFQTPGSAVFVKDNFVLTVDATALPETFGPNQVTRDAFAYQVATTVLACWSE